MKKRCWLLLICLLLACMGCVAQAEGEAVLSLYADNYSGYGGDEITLTLYMNAESVGGLQTTLTWNTGYLTYVEGSAAFSQEFADSAMVHMINVTDGSIHLVYGSTSGYTAQGEAIFSARFRLADDVTGETMFDLSGTKVTDASADLASMKVSTSHPVYVQTMPYDAGTLYIYPSVNDIWPTLGSTITVGVYGFGVDSLGSLQGTLCYDPQVLEYVADSAAFSQQFTDAGFTMLINDDVPGAVGFVYTSTAGCSPSEVLTMRFKVIGGVNEYASLYMEDMKATNASTLHLSMVNVSPSGTGLYPQPMANVVYYTAHVQQEQVKCGDTVTLGLRADGMQLGGSQGVITYDASTLTYVAGSAAFTDAFAQNATVTMINDGVEGKIQFVYANAEGYTPDGSDILMAQFVAKKSCDSLQLTGLKNTTTGATPQPLSSEVLQGSIPAVVHTEVVQEGYAATCTTDGLAEGRHCTRCREVFSVQEVIPATGHSEEVQPGYPASCTENGWTDGAYCTVCGELLISQKVIPAQGHSGAVRPGYAATCVEDGLTDGTYCTVCGATLVEQEVIPATGHIEEVQPGHDATCTENGSTAGVYCIVCGYMLLDPEVIPATGHTEAVMPGFDATCTENGWTDGVFCIVCGESLIPQEDIPAMGHTEAVLPGYDATCTENGRTDGAYCTVCNEVIIPQAVISAVGHSEAVRLGYAATCTSAGLTDGTYCTVCDHVLLAQEVIPATGHSEAIQPGYAATCTENGWTDGTCCTVCGEMLIPQEDIPATGHSEAVMPGSDATCTESGWTDGVYCTVCDEVLIPQKIIPTTSHTEIDLAGYAATCVTDGLTAGKGCANCDAVFVEQTVIPATGHTEVVDKGIPATHITTGLTEGAHCSVCSVVLMDQQIVPMVAVEIINLPEQLLTIGEEAFAGCMFSCVVVPQGCYAIEAYAFEKCAQLLFVEIPETVTTIDATAFSNCSEDMIIVTTANSPAHSFAQEMDILCVLIPGE